MAYIRISQCIVIDVLKMAVCVRNIVLLAYYRYVRVQIEKLKTTF